MRWFHAKQLQGKGMATKAKDRFPGKCLDVRQVISQDESVVEQRVMRARTGALEALSGQQVSSPKAYRLKPERGLALKRSQAHLRFK